MNNVTLKRSEIVEWGIDNYLSHVILVGFKYSAVAPIDTLILQIPEEGSDLARENVGRESQGLHVEIDERSFYGGVLELKYIEDEKSITMVFNPEKYKEIGILQIELPSFSVDQTQLLRDLVRAYRQQP
jgi:hypothetical protein